MKQKKIDILTFFESIQQYITKTLQKYYKNITYSIDNQKKM